MLVQRSLQPPPVPAVRIAGGHVATALARHFKPRLYKRGHHVGAATHRAVLNSLHQVIADQLARVGFLLKAGPQLCRLDVGAVSGLLHPGPSRIVWPNPAVLVVEGVAQRVEGLLPAGRRDVEALARLQVALRGEDVHVNAAALLAVLDRRPRASVRLQSRPGRLLELVDNRVDLRAGRPVLRRPRDHGRCVLVLELQRVGHRGHHVRVPAEDFDALAFVSGRVPLADEIVGRRAGGAGAAPEALNVHRPPPRRGLLRAATARTPQGWRSP